MKFIPLGTVLEDVQQDYETAQKVDRWRVGRKAFYAPGGFRAGSYLGNGHHVRRRGCPEGPPRKREAGDPADGSAEGTDPGTGHGSSGDLPQQHQKTHISASPAAEDGGGAYEI